MEEMFSLKYKDLSHLYRCFIFVFVFLFLAFPMKGTEREVEAVRNLIERITPGYSSQFVLELVSSSPQGEDVYEIDGTAAVSYCVEIILWHWLPLSINI